MSAAARACYRLARPQDALAIGVLARRVSRQWILPEQPLRAAALLLSGMGARVIRSKILAGQRFHLAWLDGRLDQSESPPGSAGEAVAV